MVARWICQKAFGSFFAPLVSVARARATLLLGLCAELGGTKQPHLRDLLAHDAAGTAIRVADHCYGCTAGQGSSCGGALEAAAPAVAEVVSIAAMPATEGVR